MTRKDRSYSFLSKLFHRGKLNFVIQKHDASHLHYDFRLEIDGVMVSWAIPKEMSPDPSIKRLAVRVGDHVKSYNSFEGIIPKGKYGAGTVMIWDKGTYYPEQNNDPSKSNSVMRNQLLDGSIKIILEGNKLNGSWHLFQLKGQDRNWLLVKSRDTFSRKDIKYDQTSVLTGRTLQEIKDGKR